MIGEIKKGVEEISKKMRQQVFSVNHLVIGGTGVRIPGFTAGPMKDCFASEDFGCEPEVHGLLGDKIPQSHNGNLVCSKMDGYYGDLIFAAISKVGQGAYSKDHLLASSVIVAAGVYFTVAQVDYLVSNKGTNGCCFGLSEGNGCNYFPIADSDGQIWLLSLHEPNHQSGVKPPKYWVEIIGWSDILGYACDKEDRFFFANMPLRGRS